MLIPHLDAGPAHVGPAALFDLPPAPLGFPFRKGVGFSTSFPNILIPRKHTGSPLVPGSAGCRAPSAPGPLALLVVPVKHCWDKQAAQRIS